MKRSPLRLVVGFVLALLVPGEAVPALAEGRAVPVPRVTLYPGDRIDESMLEDLTLPLDVGPEQHIVELRRDLVGKIARRTLLPGQPIAVFAIDNPRIVAAGAQVKLVFAEQGMYMSAVGLALQPGSIGEIIRVRNSDSGLMVSGRVQPDGSVKVSEL